MELNNYMRALSYLLLIGAVAAAVFLTPKRVMAQTDQSDGGQRQRGGRQRQGNFDPAQMQERMIERYKERLEVTDDAEWKALQPLIKNILDARMAVGAGRGPFVRSGRPGGDANQADSQAARRAPGVANPAAEELQKTIDAKASTPEIKAALARYVEYRKAKQAELEKARDALRAVLTSRQEAIATLAGLL